MPNRNIDEFSRNFKIEFIPLFRELKRILLLIENFVPIEVKTRLYTQARYDEELEEWTNNSNRLTDNTPLRRPVSQPHRRRPISEYALKLMQKNEDDSIGIRGENILMHELDMPLRTTTNYKNPKISASLNQLLTEALQTDDEVDITGQVMFGLKMPIREKNMLD